jgi:diguanylate cyclase (GGDEF)-like protein
MHLGSLLPIQTAELVVPAIAAGALLPGFVLFAYAAWRSGERIQYAVTLVTLLGLLYSLAEVLVVHTGGIVGDIPRALQIRRAQQVIAAWFLVAIPLFLCGTVDRQSISGRLNRGVLRAGLAFAGLLTLIAFLTPDSFSSVTELREVTAVYEGASEIARGGWALAARDLLLGIWVIYAFALSAYLIRAHKSPTYLVPSLVGLGLGVLLGADDLAQRLLGTHVGPFPDVPYPRTVVGVSFFVFGAMLSSTARYVESTRQVQQAHDELRANQRELSYLAFYDQLTHVRNRKAFYRELGSLLAGSNRGGDTGNVALLYIDLDRFKQVNDGYGHGTGDSVLRQAAARFTQSIRRSDELFRLGGDEFVVILPAIREPEDAGIVADKLIRSLEQPVVVRGRSFYLGASVGISLAPQDGTSSEELVQAADRALYAAKREGNNYLYHDAAIQNTSIRNLRIVSGLHDAVREDQFYLHYQPIFAADGSLAAVEALLRWSHPTWGEMPTATFINVAEQSRLIVQVGKWALEHACADTVRLRAAGVSVPVSVNISAKQLMRSEFIDYVAGEIRDHGLELSDFHFEITESSLMEDTNTIAAQLSQAHERGMHFVVDDFGKGYSTLAYLKHLPIDSVKIDRSFIRSLPDSGEDAAILKGVQEIARGLGIRLVAEGVETEEQHSFLASISVDLFQGYLFGRPMALSAIIERYGGRRKISGLGSRGL